MTEISFGGISTLLLNRYLALILRLILGIMFIVSAQSKLPHHSEFVIIVKDYDLLPGWLAGAYGNALPWIELLVGVYLVMAILTRLSAIICFLNGISFMIANITAVVRGHESCGSCFGELIILPVYQAIIIDVLVLIASAILIFYPPENHIFSLESLFKKKDTHIPDPLPLETP